MKRDLKKELANKSYKIPGSLTWKFLVNFAMKPFVGSKYKPHVKVVDDINKCDGPCFLIYNHQARCDYVWISECCYPRPINFLTNYGEFFRSHLHGILGFLNAIPKKMFTQDLASMRGMKQIIDKGGVVCFAPEGTSCIVGHSQPIVPGTGRFFQYYDIPVYVIKIKGGFLTNHKCCLDDRIGRVDAELSLLFSKEDLKKLSPKEIEEKTNAALWQDDYEWNKGEHIKWKTKGRICTNMHDLCYKCPKCGAELEMIGEKNYLKCNHCGNGAYMNDYYEFEPFPDSVIPASPSKWTDWERQEIIKEIRSNPDFTLSERVKIGMIPSDHFMKNKVCSEPIGEGTITIDHKGFHFVGTKKGEPYSFDLNYSVLYTLSINVDCTWFALFDKGEFIQMTPERRIVGKLLFLVEEMSRYHTNVWPNLPQLDYLYEGMELGIDNKK